MIPSPSMRRHARVRICLGLAAWCLGPASPALAQSLAAPSITVLAGTCASCHGPNGQSSTAMPRLAGQPEARLLERMRAFKEGTVPGATVMPRLMKSYDASQIQAPAQWFSEIK